MPGFLFCVFAVLLCCSFAVGQSPDRFELCALFHSHPPAFAEAHSLVHLWGLDLPRSEITNCYTPTTNYYSLLQTVTRPRTTNHFRMSFPALE
jgi:hypothetical protein